MEERGSKTRTGSGEIETTKKVWGKVGRVPSLDQPCRREKLGAALIDEPKKKKIETPN